MTSGFGISIFKYRRRSARIIELYEIFEDSPKRLLHPIEISRECGLHMLDVIEILEAAPEIFLRLPSANRSMTRYGLRPSIAAQTSVEVMKFVNRKARLETLLFFALVAIAILSLFVVALASVPYFIALFSG